ncbi:hypothetical protein DPEC_G00068400 [Dallia pectoralis]|uniref:Uncharacterized protein n=1 Tax=Dallia pectoralis TaxID=75939 RepID=A0ACC2H1T5_DALPE|nr:hypothetical protein DPEC_G00068400 [Dallia pectoralis]
MDTTAEEVQDAVMWISADVDGMPSESYASGVQYMDTTAEDLQINDTTMVSIFDSTVDWTCQLTQESCVTSQYFWLVSRYSEISSPTSSTQFSRPISFKH